LRKRKLLVSVNVSGKLRRKKTKNSLSRQKVDGVGADAKGKGKHIYVKISNRKPARGTYLNGKLTLDKKRGSNDKGYWRGWMVNIIRLGFRGRVVDGIWHVKG
jgi:hypothetical protein